MMTYNEIRARYLSGEVNEFGTLKDLLMLAIGEQTSRGEDLTDFGRIVWALTKMDALLDEKLKLLNDDPPKN